MIVRIGPVSPGSVTLWVAYARTVLALNLASPSDPALDEPTIELLERFLDEWDELAASSAPFVWATEIESEQVEFVTHTFFRIADALAEGAKARGYPISPPEGDEFYQALVNAVIEALHQEGRSMTEFSEQLRERWPGRKEP